MGRLDDSRISYPTIRRSQYDNVGDVMERSMYARTWALVKELKGEAESAMDYVRAVDAHLSRPEFRYIERPTQPPAGLAALDFFINESHVGYCQHFAGAMALMLRMGGVPARVATGFSPGGYSDRKGAWIVRDTDAHAWVEVWFDEYGWITIDPTPAATPARSLSPRSHRRPRLRRRAADTGADGAASGNATRSRASRAAARGRRRARRGRRRRREAVVAVRARRDRGARAVLAIVLFLRRPRGKTPMDRAIYEVEDAMRRVGRPVTTGTT